VYGVAYRSSVVDVSGWQQEECGRWDTQLEVDGLRAEVAYAVRPVDCSAGTVIPAHVDIDDPRWDDDPRVQRWRRETQLGRVPRRETPKSSKSRHQHGAMSAPQQQRTIRDPRLKTSSDPAASAKLQFPLQLDQQQSASTMSHLALQQRHIQEMVQQLMQHSVGGSTPTSAPVTGTSPATAPAGPFPAPTTTDADINTTPFSAPLPQPDSGLPCHGAAQPTNSSVPPPSTSCNPVQRDAVVGSSSVPAPSISSSTVTADVLQQPFKVPLSAAPVSGSDGPAATTTVTDQAEEHSASKRHRKVDYHNDPRFKKRKATKRGSGTSTPPVSDSGESAGTETGVEDSKDVLEFQSPLAVSGNTRPSTAASGYNRPPNKRYQQLVEQASRDRHVAGSSCPRRQPASSSTTSDYRQSDKTNSAQDVLSTTLEAMATYPGIFSRDADSLAKGSLKDMFKTIDPTASPFC